MFQNDYASVIEMIDALKGSGIDTKGRNNSSGDATMCDEEHIFVG